MNTTVFAVLLILLVFLPFILWIFSGRNSGQTLLENFLNFHDERFNGFEAGILSLTNRIEKISDKARAMILVNATLLFIEIFIAVIFFIRHNAYEVKVFLSGDLVFLFVIVYFILVLTSLIFSIRLASTHVLDTVFFNELTAQEILARVSSMETSQLKQFMIYFLDKLDYSEKIYNGITVLISSSVTLLIIWTVRYFYSLAI